MGGRLKYKRKKREDLELGKKCSEVNNSFEDWLCETTCTLGIAVSASLISGDNMEEL